MSDFISKYISKFVATDGTKYALEISYPSGGIFSREEEVTLSANPVRISYQSEDKLAPIVQSRATVELISHRDSMYHHLYSLEGRDVALEIYEVVTKESWEYPSGDYSGPPVHTIREARGETLWRGTIDPEAYEEPYTSPEGYTVRLTFGDFGTLKRRKHSLRRGVMKLRDIVQEMLDEAQFRVDYVEEEDENYSGEYTYGYTPATLSAETSTKIGGESVLEAGYVHTSVFFRSDGEPMTCFEVLEGVLRSFRLRIEQRGGAYHTYDNNTLSRTIVELTRAKGNEAMLMADRVYNNITLTTDPRLEQSQAQAPEVELSDAIAYTPVPRIDVDGLTAYEVRTELHTAGTLKVQTRPATTGEAMTAIALYYDPTQTQGLYSSTPTTTSGTLYYRVREERDAIAPNGYLSLTVEIEPNKPRPTNIGSLEAKPNPSKRLLGFGKAYEKSVGDNRRVFSDSSRRYEAVTSFSFPLIGQIDRGLYHLELGSELFVGVGKSLYQSLVEEESFAKYDLLGHRVTKPSKDRERYADFERAEVFFTVEALDNRGVRRAYLKQVAFSDEPRHSYLWSPSYDASHIERVRLMFGGVDGLKPNTWAKAKPANYDLVTDDGTHEPLRKELRRWEELWGNALGLIIPLPEEKHRAQSIRVTLYSGVKLQLNVGGEGADAIVSNGVRYTKQKFYERMYQEGLIAPNYVLIRNLAMRLSRRDGRRPNEDDSTTHAYINPQAYEPTEEALMLTTDPSVEAYSPARLRDKDGRPIDPNALTVEGEDKAPISGTIAELYATAVASQYAQRGHIIEGTYGIRRHPSVIDYCGKRYMVMNEEINLRDNKSRLTMATFRPDKDKPKFYTPKKKTR